MHGPEKFCPECGTARTPGGRFCAGCGYRFTVSDAPQRTDRMGAASASGRMARPQQAQAPSTLARAVNPRPTQGLVDHRQPTPTTAHQDQAAPGWHQQTDGSQWYWNGQRWSHRAVGGQIIELPDDGLPTTTQSAPHDAGPDPETPSAPAVTYGPDYVEGEDCPNCGFPLDGARTCVYCADEADTISA